MGWMDWSVLAGFGEVILENLRDVSDFDSAWRFILVLVRGGTGGALCDGSKFVGEGGAVLAAAVVIASSVGVVDRVTVVEA